MGNLIITTKKEIFWSSLILLVFLKFENYFYELKIFITRKKDDEEMFESWKFYELLRKSLNI